MSGPILLTVDIGNTNICFGPYEGETLRGFWRISTDRHRTSDEYRPLLRELLADAGLLPTPYRWRLSRASSHRS